MPAWVVVQVRVAPVASDITSTVPCCAPLSCTATASLRPPGLTAMPSAYSPGGSGAAFSAVSRAERPPSVTRSR
jgi:hypothetical protein